MRLRTLPGFKLGGVFLLLRYENVMNKYQQAMYAAALDYAARGWAVLPTTQKKHPLNSDGSLGASTDYDVITKWWKEYPDAQIGIATGEVSGFWVVDIDEKNGVSGIQSLKEYFGDNLDFGDLTPIQKTPSGGFHILYKWDVDNPVRNAQKILPGIDIRGVGGFIQAAPSSANIDGEWISYRWNDNQDTQPAKEWALTLASRQASSDRAKFNVEKVMRGLTQGERDNELWRYACHLKALQVPFELAEAFLRTAASKCSPPFDEMDAVEKVQRAYQDNQEISGKSDIIELLKARRKQNG